MFLNYQYSIDEKVELKGKCFKWCISIFSLLSSLQGYIKWNHSLCSTSTPKLLKQHVSRSSSAFLQNLKTLDHHNLCTLICKNFISQKEVPQTKIIITKNRKINPPPIEHQKIGQNVNLHQVIWNDLYFRKINANHLFGFSHSWNWGHLHVKPVQIILRNCT